MNAGTGRARLCATQENDATVVVAVHSKAAVAAAESSPAMIRIVCLDRRGKSEGADIVASAKTAPYKTSLYNERKEEIADKVMDSPIANIFTILFNPTSLVLALYFSSIAWSKVSWMQRLLTMVGRGDTKTKGKSSAASAGVDSSDSSPLQIFECEVCQMEMRPAKGRADVIFGRERFRCSRCGAKASAYFNVNDLSDERAVARLERIKEQEESDDYADDEE